MSLTSGELRYSPDENLSKTSKFKSRKIKSPV